MAAEWSGGKPRRAVAFLVTRQLDDCTAMAVHCKGFVFTSEARGAAAVQTALFFDAKQPSLQCIRIRFTGPLSMPLLPTAGIVCLGGASPRRCTDSCFEVTDVDPNLVRFGLLSSYKAHGPQPPTRGDFFRACVLSTYPVQACLQAKWHTSPVDYVLQAMQLPVWQRLNAALPNQAVPFSAQLLTGASANSGARSWSQLFRCLHPRLSGVSLRWHTLWTAELRRMVETDRVLHPARFEARSQTLRDMGYNCYGASPDPVTAETDSAGHRPPRRHRAQFDSLKRPRLSIAHKLHQRSILDQNASLLEVLWVERVVFFALWSSWLQLPWYGWSALYLWRIFRWVDLDTLQCELIARCALGEPVSTRMLDDILLRRGVQTELRDPITQQVVSETGLDDLRTQVTLDGACLPPMFRHVMRGTDGNTALGREKRLSRTQLRGCGLAVDEAACFLQHGMWCEWHAWLWELRTGVGFDALPRDTVLQGLLMGMVIGNDCLVKSSQARRSSGLHASVWAVHQREWATHARSVRRGRLMGSSLLAMLFAEHGVTHAAPSAFIYAGYLQPEPLATEQDC